MEYHEDTPQFAFEAEIKTARDQMEKVLARLESGEAFETVVGELKAGKGPLKANDIGMFRFGVLSPELQAAVGDLEVGEHTGLLDTNNGFQIFYVYKIEGGSGKQFDAVSAEIQEKLFNDQVDRRFDEWLHELRERSHVQIIR